MSGHDIRMGDSLETYGEQMMSVAEVWRERSRRQREADLISLIDEARNLSRELWRRLPDAEKALWVLEGRKLVC